MLKIILVDNHISIFFSCSNWGFVYYIVLLHVSIVEIRFLTRYES